MATYQLKSGIPVKLTALGADKAPDQTAAKQAELSGWLKSSSGVPFGHRPERTAGVPQAGKVLLYSTAAPGEHAGRMNLRGNVGRDAVLNGEVHYA